MPVTKICSIEIFIHEYFLCQNFPVLQYTVATYEDVRYFSCTVILYYKFNHRLNSVKLEGYFYIDITSTVDLEI